jgi:hypothetical protein
MNKKTQSVMMEILIALAIIFTGGYIVYYAITHYNMQCNFIGNQGYWCVIMMIVIGLIFMIVGAYGAYSMIRGRGAPIQYE